MVYVFVGGATRGDCLGLLAKLCKIAPAFTAFDR
jgi:hypothetical protein